ncbi:MAG: hypothetical protein ACR2FZ_07985 [Thermoleophilaceae bacterium]|nr:hypothetical protein [Thermoleophilaceae bacterium]
MTMESVRSRLVEKRRWSAYLLTFEGHEALGAFLEIEEDMPAPDYWRLLGDAWTAADSVAPNLDTWRRLFSSPLPHRDHLMRESERPLLAALPDEVTAYRGHSHEGGARGLAWTLSRESAEKFAHQFATSTDMGYPTGDPLLATVVVPRAAILGLFQDRREGDVVILDLPADVHVEPL